MQGLLTLAVLALLDPPYPGLIQSSRNRRRRCIVQLLVHFTEPGPVINVMTWTSRRPRLSRPTGLMTLASHCRNNCSMCNSACPAGWFTELNTHVYGLWRCVWSEKNWWRQGGGGGRQVRQCLDPPLNTLTFTFYLYYRWLQIENMSISLWFSIAK